MVRRAARQLARLLPAFAAGFALAAGGWGCYLRDDWPYWPGGRVAEYDRRHADGFAGLRSRVILPADAEAAPIGSDMDVLDALSFKGLLGYYGPLPQMRRWDAGPFDPRGLTLQQIITQLDSRSRQKWEVEVDWTFTRLGGGFGAPVREMQAGPAVAAIGDDGRARLEGANVMLMCPNHDPGGRFGLVASLLRPLGVWRGMPSHAAHDADGRAHERLRNRLLPAWRAARSRGTDGLPRFADLRSDHPWEQAISPRQDTGLNGYFFIEIHGDPRQQAAVADELRRLIVTEIVADVTLAGVGGGALGAVVFAGGSGGLGVIRRRRRARGGLCAACGYDLRGSDAGGRCPECGRGIRHNTVRANSDEPRHDVP